jgi:hypothetical protein
MGPTKVHLGCSGRAACSPYVTFRSASLSLERSQVTCQSCVAWARRRAAEGRLDAAILRRVSQADAARRSG